jgi:LPXTG-motif cell wall-anchored protein
LSYQGVGGCTVTNSTLRAGTAQTVNCTGFEPGIHVTGVLHGSPVGVGSHTVAGDGTLSFTFTVPISTSGGSHSVALRIGSATIATTPTFSVTAVPQLPETGIDPTAALLAALALLALGGILLLGYAVLRERAT